MTKIMLICLFVIGCLPDRDECPVSGAMRCDDNIAQVCTSDGVWMDEEDCDEVQTWEGDIIKLKCCEDDGEAVCVEVCR
jgi:hypothetical protein